jgi:hypothetical protein
LDLLSAALEWALHIDTLNWGNMANVTLALAGQKKLRFALVSDLDHTMVRSHSKQREHWS